MQFLCLASLAACLSLLSACSQPAPSANVLDPEQPAATTETEHTASHADAFEDENFEQAFRTGQDGIQLKGRGEVFKILPDDTKGSRHQKFLVRLRSGQTLLVAHNIDLAPRVANLQRGDHVSFYGEYAWTEQGGVMHWTHHDPAGRHQHGWIKHNGETYQ